MTSRAEVTDLNLLQEAIDLVRDPDEKAYVQSLTDLSALLVRKAQWLHYRALIQHMIGEFHGALKTFAVNHQSPNDCAGPLETIVEFYRALSFRKTEFSDETCEQILKDRGMKQEFAELLGDLPIYIDKVLSVDIYSSDIDFTDVASNGSACQAFADVVKGTIRNLDPILSDPPPELFEKQTPESIKSWIQKYVLLSQEGVVPLSAITKNVEDVLEANRGDFDSQRPPLKP